MRKLLHKVWPWLAGVALGVAVVAYTMPLRTAVVAHNNPVFAPPAEIAAAMNAQGSTQMPPAAAVAASTPPAVPQADAAKPAVTPANASSSSTALPVSFQFLGDFKYDDSSSDPGPGLQVTSTLNPPKAPSAAPESPVIPAKILALNGKKVAIQGFMIPLDMDSGKTSQFALVAVIPGCFYCQPPGLNQYVIVTMKGGQAVDYPGPTPMLVTGKFAIGEVREGGVVTSIYRMEGEEVAEGGADQPKQQF